MALADWLTTFNRDAVDAIFLVCLVMEHVVVGRAVLNSSNSNRKPPTTSAGDNDSQISLCAGGQVIPKAHDGLRVATAMESLVTSNIEAHMSSNASSDGPTTSGSEIRIILTGHSAGGGGDGTCLSRQHQIHFDTACFKRVAIDWPEGSTASIQSQAVSLAQHSRTFQ